MPKSVALDIYVAMYWDAQRCDGLPSGVDYAVFDYGVNSGIGRAKKVLQRVVGVTDDGDLGPLTMQAVAAHGAAEIVAAICDERLTFLKSLKTWPVFGKGWASRVADVRRDALALVGNPTLPGQMASRAATVAGNRDTAKGVVPQPDALRAVVKGGSAGAAIASAAASHAAITAHPWTAAAFAAGIFVLLVAAMWVIARRHDGKQDAPASAAPSFAPGSASSPSTAA